VATLAVDLPPDAVVVKLEVRGDPSLELYTAEERKGLLEVALDTEVHFVV
jgi:hypothetical protein